MDMKLELVVLPVSDVDRAKRFYERLGFRVDVESPPTGIIGSYISLLPVRRRRSSSARESLPPSRARSTAWSWRCMTSTRPAKSSSRRVSR